MNRKRFLVLFVILAVMVVLAGMVRVAEGAKSKRPNILFILTDDQRNDTLGCSGHPIVKTPNIDRLAGEGVRFENMFVTTSICAASRASIFTGLMERNHGFTFLKPKVRAEHTQASYPAMLKKAGYRTGFVGKYGCQMDKDRDLFDAKRRVVGPGYHDMPDGSVLESTEVIGNWADRFIRSNDSRPFCLSISFHAAHANDMDLRPGNGHYPYPMNLSSLYEDKTMPLPNLSDPKYYEVLPTFLKESMHRKRFFWRWDTPEKYQTNMRSYLRMITGIDEVVGKLVKRLEQMGIADNTIIIYTADNGYYMGDRGFAGKWSHFEQSLRVPLIVYDPRLPEGKRGRVVSPMALNIDLAPTMLEMAGVEIPKHYDGRSLGPIVNKDPQVDGLEWRDRFFCEHLMEVPMIPKWEGVRTERYKYARYFGETPSYEFLHDLKADPTEFKNLVDDPEYKETLKQMRGKMDAFAKENPRELVPEGLMCENMLRPNAVDEKNPVLSWVVNSDIRGQKQVAYQIVVSESLKSVGEGIGDVWDTGKVAGGARKVTYAGKPLRPFTLYNWAVRIWDKDGNVTRWSMPSKFAAGVMGQENWVAKWINDGKKNPLPYSSYHRFIAPKKKDKKAKEDKDAKEEEKKPYEPKAQFAKDIKNRLKAFIDGHKYPLEEDGFFKLDPAPLFRKDFRVSKEIRKAQLYITGLGYYQVTINGVRPVDYSGDRFLDPGWTDYSERIYYSAYNITRQLKRGENCLGVTVGNGWYNPLPLKMWRHKNLRENVVIGRPRFISQLRITYEDGSVETVVSDESWKVTEGPILRNSIYIGEIYDARKEIPGWEKPGFDDSKWRNASLATEKVGKLVGQPLEPIRASKKVRPVAVTEPEEGVYVVDMGQNFSGLATFEFDLPKGTQVNIRYGELIYNDGTLNPMTSVCGQIKGHPSYSIGEYLCKRPTKDEMSIRGRVAGLSRFELGVHPIIACQEDVYISGGGKETYTPKFTWHAFRYIEITGSPVKPSLDSIEAVRLNSDLRRVGEFACSNELFNSIQNICDWTFLSNIFSVQSDCPHRERFGYGGDLINTNEAYMYNYDMVNFYSKAVMDWDDAKLEDGMLTDTAPSVGIQYCGVGWAVPHSHTQLKLYQYYGDKRIIERQYETSKTWLGLVTDEFKRFIVDRGLHDHEQLDRKAPERGGYRVELLSGGVVVASADGDAPANGSTWKNVKMEYTSGENASADPNVGGELEIRLVAIDPNENFQIDFDNVRLVDNGLVEELEFVCPEPNKPADKKAEGEEKKDEKDKKEDVKKDDKEEKKEVWVDTAIVNGGFEDPNLPDGVVQDFVGGWNLGRYDLNADDPTVWGKAGKKSVYGIYDPNGMKHGYDGKAKGGQNAAFVVCEPGYEVGLRKVLDAKVMPETTYKLSVEVGNPFAFSAKGPMITPLYYQSAKMLEEMAGILGKNDDAAMYAELSENIKKAYNEYFYDAETGECKPGTQTSQSFALFSDILAEKDRAAAIEYLVDNIKERDGHLSTGIFGTRYMLELLSDEGFGQVAYDMVNKKTFPSWGHMLDNGATTLWEHWAYSDDTFSHSHPMFGSVSQWFYNWLGGIQPDPKAVGFDKVIIRPIMPEGLEWVKSSYVSVNGKISSSWSRKNGRIVMNVGVPANTVAMIHVPCSNKFFVMESGGMAGNSEGVEFVRYEKGAAVYKVECGKYKFISLYKPAK